MLRVGGWGRPGVRTPCGEEGRLGEGGRVGRGGGRGERGGRQGDACFCIRCFSSSFFFCSSLRFSSASLLSSLLRSFSCCLAFLIFNMSVTVFLRTSWVKICCCYLEIMIVIVIICVVVW